MIPQLSLVSCYITHQSRKSYFHNAHNFFYSTVDHPTFKPRNIIVVVVSSNAIVRVQRRCPFVLLILLFNYYNFFCICVNRKRLPEIIYKLVENSTYVNSINTSYAFFCHATIYNSNYLQISYIQISKAGQVHNVFKLVKLN